MLAMTIFYDTHAHLDFPDFEPDLEQVIARAQQAGIARIISIATDLDSSQRAIALAERYPNVFAAVGWHPSSASEAPGDLRPALRELARRPRVVALGETGLDYHRLPSQKTQGSAAALEDTLAQLQPFAEQVRGVFHCFANDAATMRRILALGSLVSFTGILTFKNGQNIRDTLAVTPLDQFMLETDCPYLAPMPYRGKRSEPAHVKEISEVAAQVKGCRLDELSAATCATAEKFFRGLS